MALDFFELAFPSAWHSGAKVKSLSYIFAPHGSTPKEEEVCSLQNSTQATAEKCASTSP
jgi:hypothetical protein